MLLDHDRVGTLIPDYLNGSLAPSLRAEVEAHLVACEDCTAELALVKDMMALDVPDPGTLFWQTLPKKVVSQAERPVPWWRTLFGNLLRPVPIAVMTALFLAVLLVPFATNFVGMPDQEDMLASVERIDIPKQQIQEIAGIVAEGDQDLSGLFDTDENGFADYQQAIAVLSQEEFDELVRELQKTGTSGGDA